jgi:hypothetical protein
MNTSPPQDVEITYSTYSERDTMVLRHGGLAPAVRKPFSSAAAGLFFLQTMAGRQMTQRNGRWVAGWETTGGPVLFFTSDPMAD